MAGDDENVAMEVDAVPTTSPGSDSGTGVVESKANGSGNEYNVNAPNFDLEQYAARYTGYTKIMRLLFIASKSPALELDAYKLAIESLKKGIDTDMYKRVMTRVQGRLGERYAFDSQWVEATDKKATQMKERIESDLNAAKSSVIKESIRMGLNDLGDFLHQRGDLEGALKSYVRSRDYCHITRHNVDMCLNVIKVSVDSRAWLHVNNYVAKAEHTPDLQDPLALTKLKAAAGLALLNQKHYSAAARRFLECSSDHLVLHVMPSAAPGGQQGQGASTEGGPTSAFAQVISAEDVATYACLCALATLERKELKARLIDSPAFKGFLELVPAVRELVMDFCHSRYGRCLSAMGELKPELLLDIYLAEHVKTLYKKIREKCLLQFFTPYLSVDLRRMASAFQVSVTELEEETAALIMANQLQARIDSQNKTLHRRQVDRRDAGYSKVLGLGQDFVREVRALLLRVSLVEHGVVVESRQGGAGGRGGGGFGGALQDALGDADPEDLMMLDRQGGGMFGLYEENQQDGIDADFKDG